MSSRITGGARLVGGYHNVFRSNGTLRSVLHYSTENSRDNIQVTSCGPITIVKINRPEVRNAVDAPTGRALLQAFRDFDTDDSKSVAILTSTSDHFCSGFDLKYLSQHGSKMYDPEGDGMMVRVHVVRF